MTGPASLPERGPPPCVLPQDAVPSHAVRNRHRHRNRSRNGQRYDLADRKSQQPAPVYRYRNDYESNFPIAGTDWTLRAGHATDIALTFLNYDIPDLQGNGSGLAEASKAMSGYFASFARSAVATAAGQPDWPRYETGKRQVMLLNSQCRVVDDPDGEERRFWQSRGKG